MEPKYDLVPIIQNPIIDPGDTVKISLYITGWGDVDSQKFYTNHHHPEK